MLFVVVVVAVSKPRKTKAKKKNRELYGYETKSNESEQSLNRLACYCVKRILSTFVEKRAIVFQNGRKKLVKNDRRGKTHL